jgi:starch synthase
VGERWLEATLRETLLEERATALLVDCPPLYDRAGLYYENYIDYPDNPIRFAFLSIAALEWAAVQPQLPSLIHCHDWHTSLTPIYAKQRYPHLRLPTVLTIHNIAYQGIFPKPWVPRLGLRWEDFTIDGFEFYAQLNFLKAGLNRSDVLTTVSPTYAKEIQQPEFGYGLDGVVRNRRRDLIGILNGIDTEVWDPASDRYLPVPFTHTNLTGKRDAKRALLETFGLPRDDGALARPVIAMVSRLREQKGLDLIEAAAPELTALDATFTVVGTGDRRFEEMWRALAAAHPTKIGVFIGFNERLAHLAEGGADMFLMPSRYEPCGLNQMYSLRYGTVPIVRAVGGLADTVKPYDEKTGRGNGFLFSAYEPAAMLDAIRRALRAYGQPRLWQRLQVNGMQDDFSWRRSAAEYVTVYKEVIRAWGNTGLSGPAS